MFQLPRRFVNNTSSKHPNQLLLLPAKWADHASMSNDGTEAQRISHKHPTYKSALSCPPPTRTHSSGRISKKEKSNVSFLLDTVLPATLLGCFYWQVLPLPPAKIHPQTLERRINIKWKFRKIVTPQTSKIYLRCPSSSPCPLSKLMPKGLQYLPHGSPRSPLPNRCIGCDQDAPYLQINTTVTMRYVLLSTFILLPTFILAHASPPHEQPTCVLSIHHCSK